MRVTDGLRHQLVTREQQDIFDYWASLCETLGRFPTRHEIEPARIVKQLPFVSLFERCGDSRRFQVRLAGTGFWNFFGSEITGRAIDDLPLGEGCAYWNRVLSHVSETALPMAGTTQPHTPIGSHLRQFWLRLPLATEDGQDVGAVLGFDQFLKAPTREPSRLMRPVFGHGTPLVAAV